MSSSAEGFGLAPWLQLSKLASLPAPLIHSCTLPQFHRRGREGLALCRTQSLSPQHTTEALYIVSPFPVAVEAPRLPPNSFLPSLRLTYSGPHGWGDAESCGPQFNLELSREEVSLSVDNWRQLLREQQQGASR